MVTEAKIEGDFLVVTTRIPLSEDMRNRVRSETELTAREKTVLDLVLAGKANKEIAATLHLSERTAKFHVSNILRKRGVTNRLALFT